MADTAGYKITEDTLRDAAILHFLEGLSWERVAKRLETTAKTLRNWRDKGEPWQGIATEVVDEMRAQAVPTSYGCLLRQAQNGDVSAAKELLNRCEGAVPQEVIAKVATTAQVALALSMAGEAEQEAPDGSCPADDG